MVLAKAPWIMLVKENGTSDVIIAVCFAGIFQSIGFWRKVFPMWIMWNDNLVEAECISAEIPVFPLISTQHTDLRPDLLPVLGLFCCGQTLSGRDVEVGRAELKEARVEGTEKISQIRMERWHLGWFLLEVEGAYETPTPPFPSERVS